jgi:predicted nucleotidyltransferase
METDLTNNDILRILKTEKPFIVNKYGVTEIGLFGSFHLPAAHQIKTVISIY